MKAITYLASFALGASALVSTAFSKELEGWSTDLDKAFAQAKKEKKAVLVEFTGSDWCPPCIAMRKNVFSKKEFVEAASKKFILVELDFPNGDPELKKKNDPFAEKYKIEGFPTVILFDSEGKEYNRFFASEYPKTDAFLKHLEEASEKKSLD
ncbi:thioredoxin family protein [Luteolibacter sp. Populi]|uniref:thioredoxin family protein n=1 Tax=Luteolibacter sp. Populi TaxID=3230487 RepID=UPI0034664F5D